MARVIAVFGCLLFIESFALKAGFAPQFLHYCWQGPPVRLLGGRGPLVDREELMSHEYRAIRDELLKPLVKDALEWMNEAEELFCEIEIPSGKRCHLAGMTTYVAFQNAEAVPFLMGVDRITPASSLARSAFEACVRASWIGFAATDQDIAAYAFRKDPFKNRTFAERIKEVEKHQYFASGLLSKLKDANWSELNGLAHGGSEQVFRNKLGADLASHHTVADCRFLLESAKVSAAVALIVSVGISDRNDLIPRLSALTDRINGGLFKKPERPSD